MPVSTDASTFFGDPSLSTSRATVNAFTSSIEHTVNSNWSLKGRASLGARHYIDCGPVILALVDVNGENIPGLKPQPLPDYIYFAVSDVDAVHKRARELNCLSTEDVHGASAGEVVKRPWGERSFYAHDPWGNGLCFVDENTLFTGK